MHIFSDPCSSTNRNNDRERRTKIQLGESDKVTMELINKDEETGLSKESKVTSFFTINEIPIYFTEDWATGIGGGLWSTGTAMGQYFSLHTSSIQENLQRLSKVKASNHSPENENNHAKIRALELGSGNGFLSLCFLAMIASATKTNGTDQNNILSEVLVTDTQDHIPLMSEIIFDRNKHLMDQMEKQNVNVKVVEHSWGVFQSTSKHDTQCFDFIFGSDLAYHESLYIPLIKSLDYFSHDNTVILLGITMSDTSSEFFDLLQENGFMYERLSDDLMGKDFQMQSTFGIFAIQKCKL